MTSTESTSRERVTLGLAQAIEEKGYATSTIADIARCAGVSKRTFYENFSDKESCFLALYIYLSQHAVAAIREVLTMTPTWPEQLHAVANAYIQALRKRPALTRAIFLEINSAGPPALATRRVVFDAFAELLQDLAKEGRRNKPALRELSRPMAMAIVAGVNELALLTIEAGRSMRLGDLEQVACDLFTAVVGD